LLSVFRLDVKKGNAVEIQDYPAAVSRNESREKALADSRNRLGSCGD
jgi:hypothetical protein